MHEKRHDSAHFVDEEVKTHHVEIEENIALTHGGSKPRYKKINYLISKEAKK